VHAASIETFSISSEFKSHGIFVSDEQLARCFPEDITADDSYLYVACGIPGYGVLKYDLATKRFAGKMAEGENFSAVWGVTVHKGFLYFTSHCSDSDPKCVPETQDRVRAQKPTGLFFLKIGCFGACCLQKLFLFQFSNFFLFLKNFCSYFFLQIFI